MRSLLDLYPRQGLTRGKVSRQGAKARRYFQPLLGVFAPWREALLPLVPLQPRRPKRIQLPVGRRVAAAGEQGLRQQAAGRRRRSGADRPERLLADVRDRVVDVPSIACMSSHPARRCSPAMTTGSTCGHCSIPTRRSSPRRTCCGSNRPAFECRFKTQHRRIASTTHQITSTGSIGGIPCP